MTQPPLVSIIIDNYNYGRFLKDAIETALAQTYRSTEVIVVDDGSTDNSKEVMANYGDRILSVLKENAGQASAFNAGFGMSRGDILLFLDSDDTLLSGAVATAVSFFIDAGFVKVQWPLWEIDERGDKTGRIVPGSPLVEGDLRDLVIRTGPTSASNAPTSGNAWSRKFLEKVFPVPEAEDKHCADAYLFTLAPLFGPIKSMLEPLGCYRVHQHNYYSRKTVEEKIRLELKAYEDRSVWLRHCLRKQGVNVNLGSWEGSKTSYAWMRDMLEVPQQVAALIPADEVFILVDEDSLGNGFIPGRRAFPFPERDGCYHGPPADGETAVKELERLRRAGAHFMVFVWSTFWWLEYYSLLNRHLRSRYCCVMENDQLVVFDLRGTRKRQPADHVARLGL